ncbi:ABC transporter permease [Mobiluncus mulieris]|uniref:ABC transporter permease n=1 Tax=Mobiluncus mulieris TaxID=2052 RepID=UPI0020930930|nr:ABC transporter permease [Mobiluncus mulieris]
MATGGSGGQRSCGQAPAQSQIGSAILIHIVRPIRSPRVAWPAPLSVLGCPQPRRGQCPRRARHHEFRFPVFHGRRLWPDQPGDSGSTRGATPDQDLLIARADAMLAQANAQSSTCNAACWIWKTRPARHPNTTTRLGWHLVNPQPQTITRPPPSTRRGADVETDYPRDCNAQTRFAAAVVAVMLGVAFLSLTLGVKNLAMNSLAQAETATLNADLYAAGPPVKHANPLDLAARGPINVSQAEVIEAVEGTAHAAPIFEGEAVLLDAHKRPLTWGFSATRVRGAYAFPPGPTLKEGRLPSGKTEVMLEESTAQRAGLKVGSQATLIWGGTVHRMQIVGIANFDAPLGIATMAFVDAKLAKTWFSPESRVKLIGIKASARRICRSSRNAFKKPSARTRRLWKARSCVPNTRRQPNEPWAS